jgi:hypothetical protein
MADHTILINVNPYTRAFSYTDPASRKNVDLSTIPLVNGDRVMWALDNSLPGRTFQIDFGALNPFHLGKPVSFRGSDLVVSSPVNLPAVYAQNNNPVFEYSVSLANGWKDDPLCMVVPEPTDPTFHFNALVQRLASPDCTISWTNATETAIVLTPPAPTDLSVNIAAKHTTATVIFAWGGDQVDTQPFTLEFLTFPPGWPKGPLADNGTGIIAPSRPTSGGAAVSFIISTNSADQSQKNITAQGTLTVVPSPVDHGEHHREHQSPKN